MALPADLSVGGANRIQLPPFGWSPRGPSSTHFPCWPGADAHKRLRDRVHLEPLVVQVGATYW